jgi:tripartite-type tricarboxylate transporter receptor subunit TctC
MQTALGVPVIVENKTGASGTIGANLVRQAPADGHTLLVGTTNLLSFPRSVLPGRSYDPVTDFVPISGLFRSDLIIAVPVKSPARNMGELVEMARKAPGRMSYGSYGLATTTHFCIEELKRRTGTHIVHVPYRGGPTMDLAGGQLDVSCDVIPAVAPLARDGRLRILGVAAPVRSSFLPDVPTVAEQGFAGFSVFTWSAVMAPKGTPAPVVETLHRVITKVIGSAEFKEQARRVAYETWATTPAELTAFIAEETVKWQKLVTEANITLK